MLPAALQVYNLTDYDIVWNTYAYLHPVWNGDFVSGAPQLRARQHRQGRGLGVGRSCVPDSIVRAAAWVCCGPLPLPAPALRTPPHLAPAEQHGPGLGAGVQGKENMTASSTLRGEAAVRLMSC